MVILSLFSILGGESDGLLLYGMFAILCYNRYPPSPALRYCGGKLPFTTPDSMLSTMELITCQAIALQKRCSQLSQLHDKVYEA